MYHRSQVEASAQNLLIQQKSSGDDCTKSDNTTSGSCPKSARTVNIKSD